MNKTFLGIVGFLALFFLILFFSRSYVNRAVHSKHECACCCKHTQVEHKHQHSQSQVQ